MSLSLYLEPCTCSASWTEPTSESECDGVSSVCRADLASPNSANIAGLSKDLGLKGNQFGTCVSVVYATYVTFEPIWANLLKKVGARRLMTISTVLWGAITIGTAFVTNFHQLVAVRVLLGAAEAGKSPRGPSAELRD